MPDVGIQFAVNVLDVLEIIFLALYAWSSVLSYSSLGLVIIA